MRYKIALTIAASLMIGCGRIKNNDSQPAPSTSNSTNFLTQSGQMTRISRYGEDYQSTHIGAGIICGQKGDRLKCWGHRDHVNPPQLTKVKQIAMGDSHACALDSDGVKCWGSNFAGPGVKDGPLDVPPLKEPKEIASGYRHSCAVDKDGIKCWGNSWWGRAEPPQMSNPQKLRMNGLTCAQDDVGIHCWGGAKGKYDHYDVKEVDDYTVLGMCVLSHNKLKCLGDNQFAKNIPPFEKVLQIAEGASSYHICLLHEEQKQRKVSCFDLITGTDQLYGYTKVPELEDPTAVYVGEYTSCAQTKKGLICWGNLNQSLPLPSLQNPTQFVRNDSLETSCFVDSVGLNCFGQPAFAVKSGGTYEYSPKFTSATAGAFHFCAIENESVVCKAWLTDTYDPYETRKVPQMSRVKELDGNSVNVCAIHSAGISCWGHTEKEQPIVPPAMKNPKGLAVGPRDYACAIDEGQVKCWGNQTDKNGYTIPSPPNLKNPRQVALGVRHICAIDDTGLVCWGESEFGSLYPRPEIKNPQKVFANGDYTCVLDDAELKCWGDLGFHGKEADKMPTLKNVKAVNVDRRHACAIDDEGLKCWGNLEIFVPLDGKLL
jgi:Regulator of chromosome condensation (RCC1) repeat